MATDESEQTNLQKANVTIVTMEYGRAAGILAEYLRKITDAVAEMEL